MRILGIDPGGSTGWALFEEEDLMAQGVIPDGVEGARHWVFPPADIIALEDFVAEPGFVGRSDASEVIGAIYANSHSERIARQLRSEKATLPGRTETERFEWLRSLGFSGVSHELDAISHCLIRLRKMRHPEALAKYWGI